LLTISQKRFFVPLDELALFMEPDTKLSLIAWAPTGHGRQNGYLHPAWKLGLRTKYFWKNLKSASYYRLIDLILAMTVFFVGMKLTLHKSQVYSCSVTQWWACSSLVSPPLPAEVGCESRERIVLLLVFIA